jgi:hypothetical protein
MANEIVVEGRRPSCAPTDHLASPTARVIVANLLKTLSGAVTSRAATIAIIAKIADYENAHAAFNDGAELLTADQETLWMVDGRTDRRLEARLARTRCQERVHERRYALAYYNRAAIAVCPLRGSRRLERVARVHRWKR